MISKELTFVIDAVSSLIQDRPITLPEDLEWPQVLLLSRNHKLLFLVWKALLRHGMDDQLPSPIKANFLKTLQHLQFRALQLLAQTRHLQDLFIQEDIPIFPLKGHLLSELLYHDPAFRISSDIDVLIDEKNLENAKRLMLREGYLFNTTTPKELGHTVYTHPTLNFEVEIHWRLESPPYELNVGPGLSFPILSNEVYLIYLCAHGTKHAWTRLLWVADIAQFWKSIPIDPHQLLALAKQTDALLSLQLGLGLAQIYFGLDLPPELSHLTQDRAIQKRLHLARRVTEVSHLHRSPQFLFRQIRFHLAASKRISQKVDVLRKVISNLPENKKSVSGFKLYFTIVILPFILAQKLLYRWIGSQKKIVD